MSSPGWPDVPPPPVPRGHADQCRRRAPGPRPRRLPRRRRGRPVPGLGDAAVRAGQPRRRDHGPPPAHDVAPAPTPSGRPGSSWPRCGPSCSGSARTSRTSSRSSSATATQLDPTELVDQLVARRLPPRVPGRAPRRGRGARLDRRRVPVDRRRAGPHRPVGRRGRPPHRVLGRRPALHHRPRRGRDLPVPRAAAHRRGAGAGRAR